MADCCLGATRFALSFWRRAVGMMIGDYDSLLLVPCRDVHTFGMKDALDIAFLNDEGVVVSVHRGIGKSRRLCCRNAYMTLERRAREGEWLSVGQRVGLAVVSNDERGRNENLSNM